MKLNDIVSKVRSMFTQSCGADMSFGESSTLNGITVIPVAKVTMGFGGGEGKSGRAKKSKNAAAAGDQTKDKDGSGLGFGGGASTMPLGIFTIKEDRVRFHPVITLGKAMGIAFLVFFLLFGFRKKSFWKR